MNMAASSSCSADPSQHKYDIFISFRGETRENFTSHLYTALRRKQIRTYIDEVSLQKGDEISGALPKAIEESTISIIIFSENYASSTWCLDELVQILKCREENGQIVLPIFYGVDPSHIRKQEGSYAAAFVKHEERFKNDMKKVQEWRAALTEAAKLSGWDSRGRYESILVETVVEDVMGKLCNIWSNCIDDSKGFVGIHRRLEKIESLLCIGSPTVRIVGIWGMGGIGKTTLARVVFNKFSNQFEGKYFVLNVREESDKHGLTHLGNKMFSRLLEETNLDMFNPFSKLRLKRKAVLLVLDGVDKLEQLKYLAGDKDWFGLGSKIIVTSRDLQVLKKVADEIYEVEALDFDEALELFYLNAFKRNSFKTSYSEISKRVVSYTKGNPLALEVLGASVFCFLESIEDWEKELKKLKRIPNDEIQAVLNRSYNALDAEEKGLFLDIACFFKGERRDFAEGILEGKPIRGLVNKSLITIEDGRICMHDLIQEMGRDIVVRSTQKLGERSRLWIAKDVSDVLENNKGSEAIEGIYLLFIDEEVRLRPDVFEEMSKLRLLKFYSSWSSEVKVVIDGDLKYLPNGLRYLHWQNYPGKSLPSNFKPQNLVELHMPYSKLEQLWDGVQKLGSLKHINLHCSIHLTKIPDLSQAPKLECINLYDCFSLIHIPSLNLQATLDESAYRHQRLRVRLGCFEYRAERTPGCINLHCCVGLTTLPKVGGNITKLDLSLTILKELPSSIESLENLLLLDLRGCKNLKSLPKLPRNIEVLELDDSGIEQIPSSSIECLCSLRILSLSYCPRLAGEFISKTLCKLTRLEELNLSSSNLESFPMLLGVCSLTHLYLSDCNIREIPDWLGSLTSLVSLYLGGNTFDGIPASIGMLNELKKLDISNCKNLQSLPASIGMLYKLKELDISFCRNLQSLPELPLFIESVNAYGCISLEMVLTLRSTLILGRWFDKYDSDGDNYQREFSFAGCSKLGEDAINNIFREFLYKVFCTATTPPEVVVSKRVIGKVVVCYRTTQILGLLRSRNNYEGFSQPILHIPKWFENQREGSSITIKLPTYWYNPKTFLGFVISVVVTVQGFGVDGSSVDCILHLMTDGDRFRVGEDYGYSCKLDSLEPRHIVMWYNYFDHSKVNFEKEYIEASFEFESRNLRVEGCGVRMLYLRDAVEKSDDGTTANFKSWRIDVNDSDSGSDDDFQSCGSDDDFQSCGSDRDDQSRES